LFNRSSPLVQHRRSVPRWIVRVGLSPPRLHPLLEQPVADRGERLVFGVAAGGFLASIANALAGSDQRRDAFGARLGLGHKRRLTLARHDQVIREAGPQSLDLLPRRAERGLLVSQQRQSGRDHLLTVAARNEELDNRVGE